MSSVSIIGLGNTASALAGRALAGGNAVEIIGHDPAEAKKLAAALGSATAGAAGAAPAGNIVILAVPYGIAAAVVSEYGDALRGHVSAFIESLGLRPLDTGPLPMARALENVGLLMRGLIAHSVKHTNFSLGVTILS